MKEHEFTVLPANVEVITEDLSKRLYEAGCDDGSPYSSQGVAGVRFHRQAATLEEAIRSAVAGVAVQRPVLEQEELASL